MENELHGLGAHSENIMMMHLCVDKGRPVQLTRQLEACMSFAILYFFILFLIQEPYNKMGLAGSFSIFSVF